LVQGQWDKLAQRKSYCRYEKQFNSSAFKALAPMILPEARNLCLFEHLAWINRENSLEGAGEIIRIAEAEFFSNLLDHAIGVLQQIRRLVHSKMLEILKWALAPEALEEPAKVRGVEIAGVGNIP
jgi:hypothetical protein